MPDPATVPIREVSPGDSLAGQLRQVHRQPDNPAQQGGQERSRPGCPAVPSQGERDNGTGGTAWDRWDKRDSWRSKAGGAVCRT
nr:hypothetical protein [uncultured Phocaeicola sp.]